MNCPTCNAPNQPDARFCMNCGASLSAEEAVPAKPAYRRWLLAGVIGGGLLLIGLVALIVYLISSNNDAISIDPDKGVTLSLPDGAQLTLRPEVLTDWIKVRQPKSIPADQFQVKHLEDDPVSTAAVKQFPSYLSLRSGVYRFELVEGPPPNAAEFSLPSTIAKVPHMLDLYTWEEPDWHWLSTYVDSEGQLIAELESFPEALALVQMEPVEPIITADLSPGTILPAEAEEALTELLIAGFTLQGDGNIETDPELPETSSSVLLIPSLRNWRDDGLLTAAAGEILSDPNRRQRHLEAIVGLALAGGYPAVQLDYRQLDPTQRQIFSAFVTELAEALDAQDRFLLVRVEAPTRITTTRWSTGAYDWAAIAQAADRLQVPLPTDPAALAGGQVEVLLSWAVGQVNRTKLQPIVSLNNIDTSAGGNEILSLTKVLAQLGDLRPAEANDRVIPGDTVTIALANLTSGVLEVDPATGAPRGAV